MKNTANEIYDQALQDLQFMSDDDIKKLAKDSYGINETCNSITWIKDSIARIEVENYLK